MKFFDSLRKASVAYRQAHSLNQTQLGELIGASQASVSDWEQGKLLREDKLEQLLDVLGVQCHIPGVSPPIPGGDIRRVIEQIGIVLDILTTSKYAPGDRIAASVATLTDAIERAYHTGDTVSRAEYEKWVGNGHER